MRKFKLKASHHNDHVNWNRKLFFYQDEIKIFCRQLKKLQANHPSDYSLLEHKQKYEKILRRKMKTLEQLQDKIKFHEHDLSSGAENSAEDLWTHQEVELALQKFIRKFENLKNNYRRFVSRH